MKRKIIIFFSMVFILFMIVLFVYYLNKRESSQWQVALGGLVVSSLPLFLLKLKNNPFSIPMILGYFFFLFCSTFLGSISKFYLHFNWWDTALHFYKGGYVGIIGIILYRLFVPKEYRMDISRWLLFLFVLSFSETASVLWEIYEFICDHTFTHTMQRGGNTDTMYDLIFAMLGGLIVAVYSVFKDKIKKAV